MTRLFHCQAMPIPPHFIMLGLVIWSSVAFSKIEFHDATFFSGINHTGPSYGASWGDFNGDGLPDLWVGNHYTKPSLYHNNGNGTFTDIIDDVWAGPIKDAHGAAWADFDRDGDQDLVEVVGGFIANSLFVNEGGVLIDRGVELGIGSVGARSRTPLWFDWNNDGDLDLAITQELGNGISPFVFRNTGLGFEDATEDVGVSRERTMAAFLSDISEDGNLDLHFLVGESRSFPGAVYNTVNVPFELQQDLSIFNAGPASDAIFADFNGDLSTDIFVTRGVGPQGLVIKDQNRFEFGVVPTSGVPVKSVKFEEIATTGVIEIAIFGASVSDVFLGKDGHIPIPPEVILTPEEGHKAFKLVLNSQDIATHGLKDFTPGINSGVYIGFNEQNSVWQITATWPSPRVLGFIVKSDEEIRVIQTIGFQMKPFMPEPGYFLRTNLGFEDSTHKSGLNEKMSCYSAASGDFDNDMDIDIYLVCSLGVGNLPNILLENQGDGTFSFIDGAGGASGTLQGSGEVVVVADYNEDGFLDLFVTNGRALEPFNNGPHQLFSNVGNSNNWIELDLNGTVSNPHGIGAIVKVTVDGETQIREQNGGMHAKSQNFQRLHFGLAKKEKIDKIEIKWPSTQKQVLSDISTNQILTVIEPSYETCPQGPDSDSDGVPNACDNCINIPNGPLRPDAGGHIQRDTNGNGFGNVCDADLNNDGLVTATDYLILRSNLNSNHSGSDLNGDGMVTATDYLILRSRLNKKAGPSGLILNL